MRAGPTTLCWCVSTLMAALLSGCGKPAAPPPPPVPELGVIVAQPVDVPLTRELVGRLSATRSAEVRARVPGILLRRVYEEGSDVSAGQVLFEIDPAPLNATLRSRQANLAQARASASNARTKLDRLRELSSRGVVSRQDVDDAQAAALSSEAAVSQAEAEIQNARLDLSYATVRAPIAGRAGKAQVTEGALVGQGEATPLTIIEQLDPLYVEFSESAAEVEALRRAEAQGALALAGKNEMAVRIRTPDGQWYEKTGTLGFSDLAVDPQTGAMALRATLPNPARRLLPGMFVGVELTRGARSDAYLVPQTAVQRDANSAYVLVVGGDGKVIRKDLQLDGMREADWIVTGGLAAGDQVIVSGIQKAKLGAPAKAVPVAPLPTPEAAPAAPAQKPVG